MERKTVFVIGAGASSEVNLPTGYELKEKISKLLDIRFEWYKQISGDRTITDSLREFTKDANHQNDELNSYLREAQHVGDALQLALSIDNFIDQHRDNQKIALCGKLAIVKSILEAEGHSLLYFKQDRIDSTINFKRLEKTWYINFFKLLTENCQKNELKKRFESITLIIFNYDRCVEFFMLKALQKIYKIDEKEAADLVKCLSIYHPYGSVGLLPSLATNNTIAFGQLPNANQLLALVQQIKTFTEGTDPDSSDIVEIRENMAKASHIAFIGFAFHKLNMNLIAPTAGIKGPNIVRCFASAYEVSHSNIDEISQKLSLFYSAPEVGVKIKNLRCNEFFNEFWNSLTF